MKHIIQVNHEIVYTVKPVEDSSELSESSVRIMESGFPDNWLVIFEDAYGKLNITRQTTKQVEIKYGKLTKLMPVKAMFNAQDWKKAMQSFGKAKAR